MCDAGSGSISSYAYIIMLIHYLQQLPIPVLPVLQQVRPVIPVCILIIIAVGGQFLWSND